MFGYIRAFKPEMKVREFELYNSVYCGLCHTIQKRYGLPARLSLSYDATFLALMLLSGSKTTCGGVCKKRCVVHPFAKRPCFRVTEEMRFAADVSIILFYYKLKDSIRDSGFIKRTAFMLLLPYFSFVHRKAAAFAPRVEKAAVEYMRAQDAVERKASAIIDEAAHPSAKMLAAIMTLHAAGDGEKRILERFGYFLGRWVYLIDAADDMAGDEKNSCYNPFLSASRAGRFSAPEKSKQAVEMLLNSCIYELCAAYELLGKGRFDGIIKNILYLGLPEQQKAVLGGMFTTQAKGRHKVQKKAA